MWDVTLRGMGVCGERQGGQREGGIEGRGRGAWEL